MVLYYSGAFQQLFGLTVQGMMQASHCFQLLVSEKY